MKIIFIDTTHDLLKVQLENLNHTCDTAYKKNRSEIESIIHKYDGVIIRNKFRLDQDFINKATNLKFIARAGSGLENIDVTYAKSKNIKCYNAAAGNKDAVAEHALGMLLALFNNLTRCNAEIRNGKWNRELNRGIEIAGKTVGIIGYGNNGSAFAEKLNALGANVLAYDKYLKKYPYQSNMDKIFKEADILSLHVSLTKETTFLVNDKFINNFRKNIYLINIARGKCVNTKALVTALKSGKVQGACLDVLEYENRSFENLKKNDLTNNLKYLINCNKIILSPHIAGWTVESKQKISEVLLQKITADFAK
tara:strand:+ start:1790 stop:2719 length:930 start_codon:yes stop_codon:yes gene_type:complete